MARRPRLSQSDREAREAITRTITRDRYASDVNARVLRLLLDLERDTIAKLADFDPADGAKRQARLKKLKKEVAEEIAARYDRISKEATGELPELARDEARWKQKSLQKSVDATGADASIALAPTSVLDALVDQPVVLGGVAASFWAAEGQALSDNFARQMQIGVASGENIGQLIARVRGTRAKNYTDGVMAVSRRNAESLVRTSVTSVANEAQMAVFRQNADVVEGLQHVAVLDSRTTLICSGRHGLTWRLDTMEPIGHSTPFRQPALHWRCRSIISSVLDLENPPALSPDFNSYFAGLPVAEQNEVFGVGRAALFREGRISQRDLLSTNGSPLTLAQLVEQHGAPANPTARTRRIPTSVATPKPPKKPKPPKASPAPTVARIEPLANRAEILASDAVRKVADGLKITPDALVDMMGDMLGEVGQAAANAGKIRGQVGALIDAKTNRFGFTFSMRGGDIEMMDRTFKRQPDGSFEVYHAYLAINKNAQGGGFGRSIMRGSLGVYDKIGVKKLGVTANIDIGGYTWARFGFGTKSIDDFRAQAFVGLRRLQIAGKIDQVEFDKFNAFVNRQSDPARLPYEFSSLTTASGFKAGKEALLNRNWSGFVDLKDPKHRALFETQIAKEAK